MMEKPQIAQKKPLTMECEAGEYWWCACGRSSEQPFCDGSHKGTGFKPVQVNIDESKVVSWCGCKHSSNKPFCDGSHNKL
jgi:CDGSH-type Zn-finger protein